MDQTVISDMKAISFRFDEEYEPHSMYMKEYSHRSYDEEKPLGRTLVVARVPLYVDETDIKKLFSEVGEVVTVSLHKGDMEYYIIGFQCAYVVYKSRESLVKALNLESLKTLTDDTYAPVRGLLKYIREYNENIYSHQILMEEATKSIQIYDKTEEEKKLKEKTNVDEDGWTVVTSKSKNLNSDLRDKQKRKKPNKNFYTFQIKDSKRANLEMLREGYEEAKRKVANMKKFRSFKPH